MRRALFLVVLAVLRCGGTGGGLDPALAGSWRGTTTLTLNGAAQMFAGQLVVTVSGDTATAYGVCLGGAGTIALRGQGASAQWAGSLVCPPAPFTNCSAVTFTLTAGSISLANGVLLAQATATAVGCGHTEAATFSFTGAK